MDRTEALAIAAANFAKMNVELMRLYGASLSPQAQRANEHAIESRYNFSNGWISAFGHRFSTSEFPGPQPVMD